MKINREELKSARILATASLTQEEAIYRFTNRSADILNILNILHSS